MCLVCLKRGWLISAQDAISNNIHVYNLKNATIITGMNCNE